MHVIEVQDDEEIITLVFERFADVEGVPLPALIIRTPISPDTRKDQ